MVYNFHMEKMKELSHEEFLRRAIRKLEKALKDAEDPTRKAVNEPQWNLRPEEDMGLQALFDGPGVPPEETRVQRIGRTLEEYRTALRELKDKKIP